MPRLVQVSAIGVERVRDAVDPGLDDVFAAYLRAKLAADDDLRARADLAWSILRPGRLTDGPGSGLVSLSSHESRGAIPRDDVAAVLLAMIDEPRTSGLVLDLVQGDTAVRDAIAVLVASR